MILPAHWLAAVLFPVGAIAAGQEPAPEVPEETKVQGTWTTSYRGRFGNGRDDHDLTEVVTVTVGDAATQEVTFHAMGHVSADLDGEPDDGQDFAFFSLSDTYDSRLTARLYHAYAEVHGSPGVEVFRIGRQLIYDTPETVVFDGARLETAPRGPRRVAWGAYGGIPSHTFESSASGDFVLGAFVRAQATRHLGLRADWLHLEDARAGLSTSDDLVQLSAQLRPDERWSLEASHSRLMRQARDLRLAGRYFEPQADLALEARYYELLTTQRELSVPLDPFFTTLFEHVPYRELDLNLSKGLGDAWFLQGGLDLRRLSDEAQEGPNNREFERGYATAVAEELLPADWTVALTGELWRGDDERFATWGVDLSRELEDGWRVDLGSYYSLFKYQFYLDEEREDVRTWYGGLRYRSPGALGLRLRYEFEDNDLDGFHTVRLGMTWHF